MKNFPEILQKINEKEKAKKPFSLGFYEVNISHLLENIQKIRSHAEKISGTPQQYLLPVKGNGYGCGMTEIAQLMEGSNAVNYLGVAHMQEAFEIRSSGVNLPILVLGQTQFSQKFLTYASEKNIQLALSEISGLEAIEKNQKKIAVHLKIDLGMGRGGTLEQDVMEIFQKILSSPYAHLTGVMMHFPVADSENSKDIVFTHSQIQKFLEIKKEMRNFCVKNNFLDIFEEVIFHCANSGAAIEHASLLSECEMLRVGIASYGYPEPGKFSSNLDLKPVVQVYSHFSLTKKFPENFSIGYGRTYATKNSERIALLPLGYADGLRRTLSNDFSVFSEKGEKFPSVGRVSMDQSAYKIPENFDISQKIFLLGKNYNAGEMAYDLETISYEILILLGSSDRLRKVWVT